MSHDQILTRHVIATHQARASSSRSADDGYCSLVVKPRDPYVPRHRYTPGARVVFVERDARDVALSNWARYASNDMAHKDIGSSQLGVTALSNLASDFPIVHDPIVGTSGFVADDAEAGDNGDHGDGGGGAARSRRRHRGHHLRYVE